ncbi:MAG: hypothetical protein Q9195_003575 [Heterodermia aff. obscurata]
MSFGFSVSDAVVTSQICFDVLKTLKTLNATAAGWREFVHELHDLQSSLSILTESLKPNEANHMFSQEQFQEPLRNALSKIRRDLLTLQDYVLESTAKSSSSRTSRLRFRFLLPATIQQLFDEISRDRRTLQTLLSAVSLAQSQEILSSLEVLTVKSSLAAEDIRIQDWLAGTDQLERHLRLTAKHGKSTGDWILAERKYQECYVILDGIEECSDLAEALDFTGSTPEYYAASLGLRHVLESLLKENEKIAVLELEAGLYAASYNGYVDIVRLLLMHGVHPDAEHWSDGRPLDASILNNKIAVVELLLNHGADITYKDGFAGGPLETAVSSGDAGLVGLVLHTLKTKLSSDPLLKALSNGLLDSARAGNLELVQLVFNADDGLDLDTVDEAGWTALHWAMKNHHDEVQQYLIDLGADIDKKNLAGETPADFAWSKRRLDLSACTHITDLKKKANQAHKNRIAKSRARTAIIREHTILQRINHPFIVSYLWYEEDYEQEMAQLYLEYCNGGDLDRYSARALSTGEEDSSSDESDKQATPGPALEPRELWLYMFQIASALAYLHHGLLLRQDYVFYFEKQWNQILHRDIKPSNVVLNVSQTGQTQAKLCDLGLAKGLGPKLKEAKETGGIGTRNYWPPEMFRKDGFWTAKGDIFSYGSTFDDLWTKTSENEKDCLNAKEILGKCMSHIPSNRPSSIQLLEMMREYIVDELSPCATNLHSLFGQPEAGYLHASLYLLAEQLDTKESYESRSVRLRRDILIRRLKNLCDDGAGALFDTEPGPSNMKLHIAILLNRNAAFEEAIKVPQAVDSSWKDSGWTPLHIAAQERNLELCDRLLEAGAHSWVCDESNNRFEDYLPRSEHGAFPFLNSRISSY